MAKQRQVVSVHLDIAALVWATRGLNSEAEWAIWGRSFVEALATQSPEKNQFAAQLIGDVIEFKLKEAKRIQDLRDVRAQSVQNGVQTVSKSVRKKVSKSVSNENNSSAARKPDPIWDEVVNLFFPEGVPTSGGSRIGKVVRDLKSIDATPEQIRTRTENMRRTDWGKSAGPEGLVKQWANLRGNEKPAMSEFERSLKTGTIAGAYPLDQEEY